MRVSTLRTIAIALFFVLIDIPLFGWDLLPDAVGLVLVFFCSVLMTDRAGRFVRPAAVSVVMGFIEVIRKFKLAPSEMVSGFLNLLYLALTVLLVITLSDGIAQFASAHGHEYIGRYCDLTGHLYSLTFIFAVAGVWFPALSMILLLMSYMIAVFALVMFIYFYAVVTTPYKAPEETAEDDWEPAAEESREITDIPLPIPQPENVQ